MRIRFDLTYTLLHNSSQLSDIEKTIKEMQGDIPVKIEETPKAKE